MQPFQTSAKLDATEIAHVENFTGNLLSEQNKMRLVGCRVLARHKVWRVINRIIDQAHGELFALGVTVDQVKEQLQALRRVWKVVCVESIVGR